LRFWIPEGRQKILKLIIANILINIYTKAGTYSRPGGPQTRSGLRGEEKILDPIGTLLPFSPYRVAIILVSLYVYEYRYSGVWIREYAVVSRTLM
jgi:hypothetical protein